MHLRRIYRKRTGIMFTRKGMIAFFFPKSDVGLELD